MGKLLIFMNVSGDGLMGEFRFVCWIVLLVTRRHLSQLNNPADSCKAQ